MGLYLEQWPIESMTGRTDENGHPMVYTISETQKHDYQCSCGAWKFQRGKLFNGRVVNPDYDTVNGRCKHIVWVIEHYRSFNVDEARRAVREGRSFVIADSDYRMTLPCGRIAGMLARMNFDVEQTVKVKKQKTFYVEVYLNGKDPNDVLEWLNQLKNNEETRDRIKGWSADSIEPYKA